MRRLFTAGAGLELEAFTERWHAIERRLDLFADRSGGIPWWDAIRYRVNQFVYDRVTDAVVAAPLPGPLPARALNLGRRIALRCSLRLNVMLFRQDVLVLRAPRQRKGNERHDPGLDPLIDLCPGTRLTIDTYPLYYHVPRRGSGRARVEIGPRLDALLGILRSEFGGGWDEAELRALIGHLISDFVMDVEAYGKLLARIRPRLVLMTQNGLEKALFAAAHAAAVPVIEAQHGLIGFTHPAYSYPRDVDYSKSPTFPSVFLAFSNYWIRSCFYPADRCIATGNDNFVIRALPPPMDPDGVMIVSGGLYTDIMVAWTISLAEAMPRRRIIHKLHPNQQEERRAIERQLARYENVDVIDGSVSARSLLPRVAHVVLIQSTVALEALQSGRRLCVLKLLHYAVHRDLFDLPGVTLVEDLAGLVEALRKTPEPGPPPSFFDPLDVDAARAVLLEFSQPST